MPNAEVERQKAAYRRGLARASAVAGLVLALMAGLTGWALSERGHARAETRRAGEMAAVARRQADEAQRLTYAANLSLIQRDWETPRSEIGHMRDLLEEIRPSPQRGFEWGYWNRLCHLDRLTLGGHIGAVKAVAFAPDGQRVLTGSGDHTAKQWDAGTGWELVTLRGHTGSVSAVAFSPDGRRLLTRSGDLTPKLWEAEMGRELLTLRGHTWLVNPAVFSPDGRRVLTVGDRTARLWFSDPEAGTAAGVRSVRGK